MMAADVLVVDDEADIRDLVAGILTDEGYDVRTATDSESALAAVRARKPALLILDIWMQGGGMDGLELLDLVKTLDADLPVFQPDKKGIASRDSSGTVLNVLAKNTPWMLGGAADLAPSTKTLLKMPDAGTLSASNAAGRNMHFGIREHAMGAIVNGLSLSKIRPYGATFLIFSDYMKPAIRLSALMEVPAIWVFTHDSIGVGEDGPTHQPIEQLASLRAVPGLITLRPADANEVVETWRVIMRLRHEPVALVLTRQALPTFDRSKVAAASGVARGAYVLADAAQGDPEVLLLATGSEVSLCLDAKEQLEREGVRARVVSMPSWEIFEQQTQDYRDQVLPPRVSARVSVEQAGTLGWSRYVGSRGICLGMKTFGASAPLQQLQQKFGFTAEHVAAAARQAIASDRGVIVPPTEALPVGE